MSESKGSFWATVPGLITGVAGLLTGIVGLIAVLTQIGVFGGGSGGPATPTTVPGAGAGAAGGATPASEVPSLGVKPATLDFKAADPREKPVTVRNESDTASLTVGQPRITGDDADRFSVSRGDCSGPLAAGESCTLRVTFAPSGPLGTHEATLQVTAPGARAQEVPLTGSTVLG